jgi:dihydrofolate reductase
MHRHDLSFVTDGIESALEQAGEAAGKKDVMVARGASAVRQYLAAGVTDEIALHLVPVVLGAGERSWATANQRRRGKGQSTLGLPH